MKSRRYNLIIGVFVMFISNIIYFFWMPYPKGFLKTVGSTTFVFDVLTNLLFFSLYSVMLIVAINAITNTGCKLRTKKVSAIMGICIAVQFGCDITKYITGYLMRQFAPISDDFFTFVSVLVLSLVVMKLLGAKVSYKKLYAIFAPIMILILIVYTVLDVRYIHSMSNVAEKYFGTPSNILSALSLSDSSSVAATISKNMEFMYEIRNALLDFASEATILIAVYFSIQTNKATNCNAYHTDKAHFVSRIAVILLFSFVIFGLKFLVLPQNFIRAIHMQNSVASSAEPSFDYSRSFITISRSTGYHKEKEIYRKTHGVIYYGDKKMLDIEMDYEFQGNPIELRTVNGIEIEIICKNQAIAYLKDEKPCVVPLQDLRGQSNDTVLLEVCKDLLSEGRFDCFEYICPYVMQYDPDFVQQYLRRYIVSDFTSEELSQVGEISIDYITKTAQRFYNGLSA